MDDRVVCTPLIAESDAQNNTTSTPNASSVTDADKVINTKIDSNQGEGDKCGEELLKGLLADDYCHVCEAVLLFESQRLSHYEGKKHAQKMKVYLQARKAEKRNSESTRSQRTIATDKDHFCVLCNMVFSSHVVASSHYEGKIHAKNLRKQGLQPTDRYTEVSTLPSLTQDPDKADQKLTPEGDLEHHLDSMATTTTLSAEVDLKDPKKYCTLCAASFNNPQMALQHYNGRKHQRNQARQELLKELGDDIQQENSLKCQMCSVEFTSVEMYQAHMQGNKHHVRKKKVIDLCKSQRKVYNTFADELSDYVQVQKARGITPKTSQVLPPVNKQMEDEEDEEEGVLNRGDITELNIPMPNPPPTCNPPHHTHRGCYNPVKRLRPPYKGPLWLSHGWDYNRLPPVLPGPGSPLLTSRPMKRRRLRPPSSSSSCITSSSYSSSSSSSSSSYSSSSSSSSSDSDDSEYRCRENRSMRREKDKRARDEGSDKEDKRRWQQKRERGKESVERRRGESEKERRRKKRKNHGKQRGQEKKCREEDFEVEGGERVMDNLLPDLMDNRKETEVHVEAERTVEQGDGGLDEPAKAKHRKEKKKTKEKVDTRTEDEKLWDDSILGC